MLYRTRGFFILVFFLGVQAQDDSLAGSFLSGLLDTITSTADSKDCPGVCVHALATIICYGVLHDVSCPSPSMKCCIDSPMPNATTIESVTKSETTSLMTTITTSTPTTLLPATTSTMISVEKKHNITDLNEPGSCNSTEFKGVCVAENIANYCEAILNTNDLCTPGLRCCVSSVTFGDKLPSNLIYPNKTKTNYTRIETRTTHRPHSSTTYPVKKTTVSQPVTLKECNGECVSGLFALFCDDIDSDADCENGASCCITEPVSNNESEPEKSVSPPTMRPPLPPTTTRPVIRDPGPICPGFCLLNIMAAFCERPSVLIPHTSNCKRGSVCCDNTRAMTSATKPKPKPHYSVPTTTTTVDSRPECPGSCIVSYLSFTCFRNAEMTEIFKCKKAGTKCCAPKSLIKDALGQKDDVPFEESTIQSLSMSYTTISSANPTHFATTEMTRMQSTTSKSPVYSKYVCGVKGTARVGRVVGGEDGEQGEWCWQVALINSLNQYLCGAALIGTQWVLTAAHCVTNIVRSGDAIYVRVGDHDLTRKYGNSEAQTLRVATTYIHHNHNSQTLDNDIALLKLHGQAELKEGVCLVCLPARGVSHAAGKRCTVTGYGYMGEAGPIPLKVREAEIPIVSDAECIRKINAVTEKIFILPASSFCAGGEEGNDACQGDGGGPLVCQDDGFYELAGLVSWGFGCGRLDVPGVYVKVSSFIGWVNQIISVNNL
ncbi:protein masquerade [Diabrotica virgifera virgifera]|uniref:Peptidase S1 domain-containing protein n=1 Tax=Diabrotica virgifera virgifera TaxID=50390 RepID=A0ABM5IWR2_DIAVI|nr:protein masquerade [Diabrotica virgifera virgifera]